MKFINLSREYEYYNWYEAIKPVFDDTSFINGKQIQQFENELANYVGTEYAVALSSGTDALQVAILSLEIKKPIVLTTPYTFIATIEMPIRLGAKIIFCDIKNDFNIDMEKTKEIIKNKRIDIFIPVHLFGRGADIDEEVIKLCKSRETHIIEDAAQAFGTTIPTLERYDDKSSMSKMRHVGSWGDIGCFSFFPSKNLGCVGDGGAITTNSKEIYKKAKAIRNHGSYIKYHNELHGGNFRMDTLQAAILLAKLPNVEKFLHSRFMTALTYISEFNKIEEIELPKITPVGQHTFNQFVIRVKDRDGLQEHLKHNGIPTAIYYPTHLGEQFCYENINFQCPCTEAKKATQENLALPIAYLTKKEEELITKTILDYYE